jgi:uncharacterized membrane protein YkvA (DUF1232 family)
LDLNLVIGVVLAIVAVWVALLVLFWILRPRGASIRDLLALVPDVLRLLRSLIADRSVPLDVRLVLLGLLAWLLSPIDLIPEFLPGIGPIDDVVVAIVAFRYVRRRVGVDDLHRRWRGTESGFELLLRVIGGGPLPS